MRFLSFPEATPINILIAQHEAIADAIAAGDPGRADAAMRIHLGEFVKSLPKLAEKCGLQSGGLRFVGWRRGMAGGAFRTCSARVVNDRSRAEVHWRPAHLADALAKLSAKFGTGHAVTLGVAVAPDGNMSANRRYHSEVVGTASPA